MSILLRSFVIGVALVICTALSVAAQAINISGTYRAEGRNPDGSVYTGTAVMTQQATTVQISWTVGNQTYSGNGLLSGQVVVINWGRIDPVVYVVMGNGELHGTWNRGTALERLLPQ